MELNSDEIREQRRLYDELVTCVKKYRKNFTFYPIAAMCIAGILYNPKGSLKTTLLKRLFFGYSTWLLSSLGISVMASLSCSNEYKAFVESVSDKKKMAETGELVYDDYQSTSGFTDNVPTTSDLNLPVNLSDDTTSNLPGSFEDFKHVEEIKPVKKPVTYDDLWASHQLQQKSWKGDEKWYGENRADTPTTRKRATNIYGDPLD